MRGEARPHSAFGIRCESGVAGWRPVCVIKDARDREYAVLALLRLSASDISPICRVGRLCTRC